MAASWRLPSSSADESVVFSVYRAPTRLLKVLTGSCCFHGKALRDICFHNFKLVTPAHAICTEAVPKMMHGLELTASVLFRGHMSTQEVERMLSPVNKICSPERIPNNINLDISRTSSPSRVLYARPSRWAVAPPYRWWRDLLVSPPSCWVGCPITKPTADSKVVAKSLAQHVQSVQGATFSVAVPAVHTSLDLSRGVGQPDAASKWRWCREVMCAETSEIKFSCAAICSQGLYTLHSSLRVNVVHLVASICPGKLVRQMQQHGVCCRKGGCARKIQKSAVRLCTEVASISSWDQVSKNRLSRCRTQCHLVVSFFIGLSRRSIPLDFSAIV